VIVFAFGTRTINSKKPKYIDNFFLFKSNLIKKYDNKQNKTKVRNNTFHQISGNVLRHFINQWVVRKHQPMTEFHRVSIFSDINLDLVRS
jgi:hypothetical protein